MEDEIPDGQDTGYLETALRSTCAAWQEGTSQRIPTILTTGTLALLNSAMVVSPSSIMLEYFLLWFRNIARHLYQTHSERVRVSENLLRSIRMDNPLFFRSGDTYWITKANIRVPHEDRRLSWVNEEVSQVYFWCNSELQNEILEEDSEGNNSGKVNAVLFSDALALLMVFNPKDWALREEKFLSLSPSKFHAPNLLWAQVGLLGCSNLLPHPQWMVRRPDCGISTQLLLLKQ
jgi:hypothetical protein